MPVASVASSGLTQQQLQKEQTQLSPSSGEGCEESLAIFNWLRQV